MTHVPHDQDPLENTATFRTAFDMATIGKVLTHPDGRLGRVNPAFCAMLGYARAELEATGFQNITHPEDLPISKESVRCLLAGEKDTYHFEKRYLRKDGAVVWADVSTALIRDHEGRPLHFITHVVDITERKAVLAEVERYRANLEAMVEARTQELVAAQESLTRQAREIIEMSVPVLQIWEGILVVPLVGTLDSERTRGVTERLLQAIVDYRADLVLLDITGVPTVDTRTAQHLLETTRSVRLLGSRVVLTGIRPAIAQTLVHLGVDMSSLTTRATLASGLRFAFGELGIPIGPAGKAQGEPVLGRGIPR